MPSSTIYQYNFRMRGNGGQSLSHMSCILDSISIYHPIQYPWKKNISQKLETSRLLKEKSKNCPGNINTYKLSNTRNSNIILYLTLRRIVLHSSYILRNKNIIDFAKSKSRIIRTKHKNKSNIGRKFEILYDGIHNDFVIFLKTRKRQRERTISVEGLR